MTDLDLTALRAVAEAATLGPWTERLDESYSNIDAADRPEIAHVGSTRNDAAHIAAFDPPTVLALIDRAERAEAAETALDRERQLFADADAGWKAAASERDTALDREQVRGLLSHARQLRAAVRGLDGQVPVRGVGVQHSAQSVQETDQ